jgi:hypothetical protein
MTESKEENIKKEENSSKEQFVWVEYANEPPDWGVGTIHLKLEDAIKAMYKRLTLGDDTSMYGNDNRFSLEYHFEDPEDVKRCKDEFFSGGEMIEENFIKNVISRMNLDSDDPRYWITFDEDTYEIHKVSLNGGKLIFHWH